MTFLSGKMTLTAQKSRKFKSQLPQSTSISFPLQLDLPILGWPTKPCILTRWAGGYVQEAPWCRDMVRHGSRSQHRWHLYLRTYEIRWNPQCTSLSGWWFGNLWKILVNGKDYPIYYGKQKMFQTTNQLFLIHDWQYRVWSGVRVSSWCHSTAAQDFQTKQPAQGAWTFPWSPDQVCWTLSQYSTQLWLFKYLRLRSSTSISFHFRLLGSSWSKSNCGILWNSWNLISISYLV